MTEPSSRRRDRERGASEVIGVVLLLGIVLAGAGVVLLTGTAVKDQATDRSRMAAAEQSMQELDAELGSLAEDDAQRPVRDLSVSSREGETVSLDAGDAMTIRVDDRAACTTTLPLDAVTHELEDGRRVVYQAGGVFSREGEGAATMLSPPAVTFRDGVLSVAVVDVTGDVGQDGDFRAQELSTRSARATERTHADLFDRADCYRPDTLDLSVDTRFPAAWAGYLRQEMPAAATVDRTTGGNVTVDVPQRALPERSDDDRNQVVNFTDPDEPGRIEDGDLLVDKPDDSNSYTSTVNVLASDAGHAQTYDDPDHVFVPVTRCEVTTETVERTVRFPTPNGTGTDTVEVTRETGQEVTEFERVDVSDATPGTNVTRTLTNESCTTTTDDVEREVSDDYQTRTVDPGEDGDAELLDVAFVIDKTGSMAGSFAGATSKIQAARAATAWALGAMPDEVDQRAALTSYAFRTDNGLFQDLGYADDAVELHQGLTTDYDSINDSLDEFSAGGSTNIGDGIARSLEHFESDGSDDRNQVTILLTDGQETADSCLAGDYCMDADPDNADKLLDGSGRDYTAPTEAIRDDVARNDDLDERHLTAATTRASDQDVTVYPVGIGSSESDVDAGTLQTIADETGGEYNFATSADELEEVFRDIVLDESANVTTTTETHETTVDVTVDRVDVDETDVDREVEVPGEVDRIVRQPATLDVVVGGDERPVVENDSAVGRAVNFPYYGGVARSVLEVEDGDPVGFGAAFWDCEDEGSMADSDLVEAPEGDLLFAPDGDRHRQTVCAPDTAESATRPGATYYVDGDDAPSASTSWWQRSVGESLQPYTADTDGDGDREFDLDSNQVVVTYDYDDGPGADQNDLVVLYETGAAHSEVRAKWTVDLQLSVVDASD